LKDYPVLSVGKIFKMIILHLNISDLNWLTKKEWKQNILEYFLDIIKKLEKQKLSFIIWLNNSRKKASWIFNYEKLFFLIDFKIIMEKAFQV